MLLTGLKTLSIRIALVDSAIEEMRERVQQTIDSQYLDPECLDCIGETAWDDWTDCKDQEISASRN